LFTRRCMREPLLADGNHGKSRLPMLPPECY
jgi:hypothetical protein